LIILALVPLELPVGVALGVLELEDEVELELVLEPVVLEPVVVVVPEVELLELAVVVKLVLLVEPPLRAGMSTMGVAARLITIQPSGRVVPKTA